MSSVVMYDHIPLFDNGVHRIVGQSPVMQEVYDSVLRVAPLDVTVLILGESGTGKELVARAIHHHSLRAQAPFSAINCAAIPETLLESELFGHERGTFTGADRRRYGKFEQANGGTLFLDEIGDMSAIAQAKVLRVLQEQQFERLGGNESVRTDVRLIAASNKNLEEPAADSKFRQDLFYRLNVFRIHLPPLRERMEDLPLLVDCFVRRFGRELGKRIRTVSAQTLNWLERHSWPGNVRELEGVIKYAIVMASSDVLTPDCLPPDLRKHPASPRPDPSKNHEGPLNVLSLVRQLLRDGETNIYQKVSRSVERVVLEEVLRSVRGNQVQASELLGISRTTLRTKIRALNLVLERHLVSVSERGK